MATCSNWNDDDNGYRASKLLVDGAGYLTKQLLLQKAIVGNIKTIDDFLADTRNKKTLRTLKTRGIIKDSQNDILYPKNKTPTDLEKWDITLVTLVLTNCCAPNQAEKDAINDIRELRNTLYGHTAKVSMSDQEFQTKWNAISTTLTKHALLLTDVKCRQHIADNIRTIQNQRLSPHEAVDILKQWREWDNQVVRELRELEGKVDEYHKGTNEEFRKIERQDSRTSRHLLDIKDAVTRKESYDAVTLERGKRMAQNRLHDHQENLRKFNLPVTTRLSEMVTKRLRENKIVVLSGIQGSGKTHLTFNSMVKLLKSEDGMDPLLLNNPEDIQKALDPNRRILLCIDDMLGTCDVNNMELDHWNRYVDNFLTLIKNQNILVLITIRTHIRRKCMMQHVKDLLKDEYIFDLDKIELNTHEKQEMLELYASANGVALKKGEMDNLLSAPSRGIGFPLLCRVIKNGNSGNMLDIAVDSIKEDIVGLGKNDPLSFIALLMILFNENRMCISDLNDNTTFEELCKYYKSFGIDKNGLFTAAKSLEKTFLSFNTKETCFSFINDTIAEATFEAAKAIVPHLLVEFCPLAVYVKFIKINEKATHESSLQDQSLNSLSYTQTLQRFKNSICSSTEPDATKYIAGSYLWQDDDFFTTALYEWGLELFYQEDDVEQKSLLCYFAGLGFCKHIQKLIARKCPNVLKAKKTRQIERATVEACLSKKTEVVMFLIVEAETNVSDEMMLAAVDGGETDILNILLENGGNIEATKSGTGENLLHEACAKKDNVMLNAILERCDDDATFNKLLTSQTVNGLCPLLLAAMECDTSIFQTLLNVGADIHQCDREGRNSLHFAAMNGNYDTVCHICTEHEELIRSKCNVGYTAAHYATGDCKCLDYLLCKGINPLDKAEGEKTILHSASCKGEYDAVLYIVEMYAEMKQMKDINGYTAAHFAAQHGSVECLQYLLEREGGGLNPMTKTEAGETLLHVACVNENYDAVKYLAENFDGMILETNNESKNAVQRAAECNSIKCLMFLLTYTKLNPLITTKEGRTLLHLASMTGATDVVMYLCENYKELFQMTDDEGRRAAHYAKNTVCLQYLIDKGIDPMTETTSGESILHVACMHNHHDIVKYILEKYQDIVKIKNTKGLSVMQYAACHNSLECLKSLKEKGLDPMATTNDKKTLLHLSAFHGANHIVKYLCEECKPLIKMKDNLGRYAIHYVANIECLGYLQTQLTEPQTTANTLGGSRESLLHVAALCGHYDVVLYLSEMHADMLHMTDKEGMNAAFYAVKGGQIECLTLLLGQGIRSKSTMNGKLTLLHAASTNGNKVVVEHLCEKHPELITITDDEGRTAAHFAKTVDCLECLMEHGIDHTTRSKKGDTFLHVASERGVFDIVLYLGEKYQDMLGMTNKAGMTAAHCAAKYGHLECLTYLLQKGISPASKNREDHTIFKIACSNERDSIVEYLLNDYEDLFKSSDTFLYAKAYAKHKVGGKQF